MVDIMEDTMEVVITVIVMEGIMEEDIMVMNITLIVVIVERVITKDQVLE